MDIIWNQDNFMEARRSPHTQPLATMPFISAHVSLQQQSGCAIDLESLGIQQRQKRLFIIDASDNLYETGVFFRFHRLHWVWKLVQVEPDLSEETCEEQEVEMDIIWNQDNFMEARRSPHTQPLATMPFISACVSLQQQSGCAIDLESRKKRLFILDASDSLYETGVFFRFHRLHWVWNLVQVEPDLSKETCEEQEVEMDIIWNQDNFMEARRSPHTQPLATMPFISAHVSLQQQSGCAIDLESLGIQQRQKRLLNVDVSDNLYETGVFFRFHRLHWVWNLVQVEPDLSKETCEEQEVEMDTYGIKIISWRLGGRHTHSH